MLLRRPCQALGTAGSQHRSRSLQQLRCSGRRLRARACAASDGDDPDLGFMARALELAKRGAGKTAPNPAVGCVIVQGGQVVGEGFHPKAGEPHAEVFALRGAGQAAAGATAYVTLEPCAHFGQTPPCCRALTDARVARVVVGARDPNPLVGGKGIAHLEGGGVEVRVLEGPLAQQCYDLNRAWMEAMQAKGA